MLLFLSANQIDPAMPASGLIIPWHIVLTIIRQVITEGITVWWFPLLLCMEEDSQIGPISPHSCHGQQRDRHSCEESSSTYQWNAFKGSCQDMGKMVIDIDDIDIPLLQILSPGSLSPSCHVDAFSAWEEWSLPGPLSLSSGMFPCSHLTFTLSSDHEFIATCSSGLPSHACIIGRCKDPSQCDKSPASMLPKLQVHSP